MLLLTGLCANNEPKKASLRERLRLLSREECIELHNQTYHHMYILRRHIELFLMDENHEMPASEFVEMMRMSVKLAEYFHAIDSELRERDVYNHVY